MSTRYGGAPGAGSGTRFPAARPAGPAAHGGVAWHKARALCAMLAVGLCVAVALGGEAAPAGPSIPAVPAAPGERRMPEPWPECKPAAVGDWCEWSIGIDGAVDVDLLWKDMALPSAPQTARTVWTVRVTITAVDANGARCRVERLVDGAVRETKDNLPVPALFARPVPPTLVHVWTGSESVRVGGTDVQTVRTRWRFPEDALYQGELMDAWVSRTVPMGVVRLRLPGLWVDLVAWGGAQTRPAPAARPAGAP